MLKNLKIFQLQKNDTVSTLPQSSNFNYNYLLGLVMLYMCLSILSGLTVYKSVALGPLLLPAGIFTTPLTYCLSNVITEVYGYPTGRNMMWWFVICSMLFTGLAVTLVNLPSPSTFKYQQAFDLILGSMPRIFIGGIIGTIIGINTNNYVVSKLKIVMDGHHYWLRSIISTCGGEIIYNITAYPIMFLYKVPLIDLVHIILSVSIFKLMTTAIFLAPECLLARYLKIKERINIFDYNVNYNPFRFQISDNQSQPQLKLVK